MRTIQRSAPGMEFDYFGAPPPNERGYLLYIVLRNVGGWGLTVTRPLLGTLDVSTYLWAWYRSVAPVMDKSITKDDGWWNIYLGFATPDQAYMAWLMTPLWMSTGLRWYAFVANSSSS